MNWFVRFVDFVICFLRSFRLMNDELFPVLWFDYVPQNISNPFENVTLVSVSNLRIRKRYTCNIFEKNILLIQLLYSGTYSGTLPVPQNLSNPFENVTLVVSVSNLRIRKWYEYTRKHFGVFVRLGKNAVVIGYSIHETGASGVPVRKKS